MSKPANVELIAQLRGQYPGTADRSDDWLHKALAEHPVENRDYVNQWTKSPVADTRPSYTYNFYYDQKYHWIVKRPNGQDQVVDPELWAQFLNRDKMIDGLWYLGTTAVDPIYGQLDLVIEVLWHDGMPHTVSLVAPDGDPIKRGIKRFQISRDQPL